MRTLKENADVTSAEILREEEETDVLLNGHSSVKKTDGRTRHGN